MCGGLFTSLFKSLFQRGAKTPAADNKNKRKDDDLSASKEVLSSELVKDSSSPAMTLSDPTGCGSISITSHAAGLTPLTVIKTVTREEQEQDKNKDSLQGHMLATTPSAGHKAFPISRRASSSVHSTASSQAIDKLLPGAQRGDTSRGLKSCLASRGKKPYFLNGMDCQKSVGWSRNLNHYRIITPLSYDSSCYSQE